MKSIGGFSLVPEDTVRMQSFALDSCCHRCQLLEPERVWVKRARAWGGAEVGQATFGEVK